MIVDWNTWNESQKNEFIELLHTGVIEINFEKVDGTMRSMLATLMPSEIPTYTKLTDRVKKPNDAVLSVVDVVLGEWRSFRLDSLRTIFFDTGE